MENVAELFYAKLEKTQSPGKVLAEFFTSIAGRPCTSSDKIMINGLIKIFGRFTVYFSIMSLSHISGNMSDNVYGYLYSSCMKRFERLHSETSIPAYENLSKDIETMSKEIEKIKKSKIKMPNAEGLK
jgi:hypothetical protein